MRGARRPRGAALVICLFMLVIVALGAMAAMRGAVGGERVVNNMRLEALAQEYAELGLRWCERELARPEGDRVPALQNIGRTAAVALPATVWNDPATWTSAGTVVNVPLHQVTTAGQSSFTPKAPQCLPERIVVPGASAQPSPPQAYLVTVRGFSPGYTANQDGTTASGAVVWLQTLVTLQSDGGSTVPGPGDHGTDAATPAQADSS